MRHLVVSDLHEKPLALRCAIEVGKQGGGYDDLWFLGDVFGHAESVPGSVNVDAIVECLDLLHEQNAICVAGNWDIWLGGTEGETESAHWLHHRDLIESIREALPIRVMEYLRSWAWKYEEDGFTLTHGCPYQAHNGETYKAAPWETYIRCTDTHLVERMFREKKVNTKHVVIGHTHEPGYFNYNQSDAFCYPLTIEMVGQARSYGNGNRYLFNPGSIAYNDSYPSPTVLIIDTELREYKFLVLPTSR